MNFTDYQELANRTAAAPDADLDKQLLLWTVAWAGEVGEFCNKVKKKVGHGHQVTAEMLAEEIGDCLWYPAAISTLLGLSLDEIATANIDKLKARYPEGFSKERSQNRPPETS